jgi:hypothetical protein
LDQGFAEAVSEIIGVHDKGQIETLPDSPFLIGSPPSILLRGLAAIFRLADMLDTTSERCPDLVNEILGRKRKDIVVTATGCIRGWDFASGDRTINLQLVNRYNHDQKLAVMSMVDALNDDVTPSHKYNLENCRLILENSQILTVSIPAAFELDGLNERNGSKGLRNYIESVLRSYASNFLKAVKYVDLSGLGIFGESRIPELSKIYIDVKARLEREYPLPKPIDEYKKEIAKYEFARSKARYDMKTLLLDDGPARIEQLDRIIEFSPFSVRKALEVKEVKRLVVLGHAGTGKSTLAQSLCWDLLSNQKRAHYPIPFKVAIRFYLSEKLKIADDEKRRKYSLFDFLFDEVKLYTDAENCPRDFLVHLLRNRETVVIFDGLDEVAEMSDRKMVKEEIDKMVTTFERPKYIATSRIYGYEDVPMGPEYLHVSLESVDEIDARKFVTSWYTQREPDHRRKDEKIESFSNALEDPSVAELTSNPLLLTIMALVNETGPLPTLRTELYSAIIDAYVKNREKVRNIVWYDYTEVKAAHEYLAFWMHLQNSALHQAQIDGETLKNSLLAFLKRTTSSTDSENLKKAEDFIRLAKVRIGLIVETPLGEFTFGLRPIQEFLTASYISLKSYGIKDVWKYVGDRVCDPYWHDVIRFLGGIIGKNSTKGINDFLGKILSAESKKAENLAIASEIISEKIIIDPEIRTKIAETCIETLTNSTSTETIANVARSIPNLMVTEARQYVLNKLKRVASDKPIEALDLFYKFFVNVPDASKSEYAQPARANFVEGWKTAGELSNLVSKVIVDLSPSTNHRRRALMAHVLHLFMESKLTREIAEKEIKRLSPGVKANITLALNAEGLYDEDFRRLLS